MSNQTLTPADHSSPYERDSLLEAFLAMRAQTETLCEPLETEDYVVQSVSDVSPPKWHLAHTSWFFENFVLDPNDGGYERYHPMYHYLFNSYYNLAGNYHPRVKRGILSRPTVSQIYDYRKHVTQSMASLLENGERGAGPVARRNRDAGHQPRAAAPGAAGHRHQAHPLV